MKFKRVAVTVLIVLAAYLLQCTLFNHLELAGIKPNLILIVTASFGFMRGQKEGMLVGFFAELDGSSQIHLDETELSTAVWMKREDIPGDYTNVSLTHEMILLFKHGQTI